MTNTKSIPTGITIIYFNAESKNIYADLPPNKEQAKRLSKRIYKDAMTAILNLQTNVNSAASTSIR